MTIDDYLKSGKYLPPILRDFHDQKNVFKRFADIAARSNNPHLPNWISAHMYVIDIFLWCMARRGYTLQRSRANVEFLDFDTDMQVWRKQHIEEQAL